MKILGYTEEELEKMRYENYLSYKRDKNNYSYWYEKVKECGIKMAESYIYQVPYEQYKRCYSENEEEIKIFKEFVAEQIKDLPYVWYNIKNGTFSNKFDFQSCGGIIPQIPEKLHLINYCSAIVDAGGFTEFVIREHIYADENIPTIYYGMPLRSEFRVFYDFDKKEVLYSVNYWDFDYCYEHLSVTDKIVFEHERQRLEDNFNQRKEEVEELVKKHMVDVDLQGKWSIDILYNELEDNYWLIDMAEAHRSAYWNMKLLVSQMKKNL